MWYFIPLSAGGQCEYIVQEAFANMRQVLRKLILVMVVFFVIVASGCSTYTGAMMGDKDDSGQIGGKSGCH